MIVLHLQIGDLGPPVTLLNCQASPELGDLRADGI